MYSGESLRAVAYLKKRMDQTFPVGFILAWPVAWYAMDDWLSKFAYRVDQGPLPYFTAGGLSLILALLTVGYQAIRAAQTDPIDALRTE